MNTTGFSRPLTRGLRLLFAAILAVLSLVPTAAPAEAHVFTPPPIPDECAHFVHRGTINKTINLDSRPFQMHNSISPDGSYGPCVGGSKFRTWNVEIKGTANRRVTIRPVWGHSPPLNSSVCRESNIVYKVWTRRPGDIQEFWPEGGGVLYGNWVAGDPGFCRWQPDNPRTSVVESDPVRIEVLASSSDTSILVSAQAFTHYRNPKDLWAIRYQSVRVMVFVRP